MIQFRHVAKKDELGNVKATVKYVDFASLWRTLLTQNICRPFIIDLESTNGTFVNDEQIPVSRYFELRPSDGTSSFFPHSFADDVTSPKIWSIKSRIRPVTRGCIAR